MNSTIAISWEIFSLSPSLRPSSTTAHATISWTQPSLRCLSMSVWWVFLFSHRMCALMSLLILLLTSATMTWCYTNTDLLKVDSSPSGLSILLPHVGFGWRISETCCLFFCFIYIFDFSAPSVATVVLKALYFWVVQPCVCLSFTLFWYLRMSWGNFFKFGTCPHGLKDEMI